MGRPLSKEELLRAADENYNKLICMCDAMTERELLTPFDFEKDAGKKEAHWRRDKNLRDVLIHLYEWHNLVLHWVRSNQNGENVPFLPRPYTWRNYGEMNVQIWKKHQNTTLEQAKAMFVESHKEVMQVVETFADEELFSKGVFPWVGTSTLGSYFISNTSSHYNWAMKKLKAHKKNCSTSIEG